MSRPKERKLTFYQGKQYSYDELLKIAHTQFDNPIPKFTLPAGTIIPIILDITSPTPAAVKMPPKHAKS